MSLFDQLKNTALSSLKAETRKVVNQTVNKAVNSAEKAMQNAGNAVVGKGRNETQTFKFQDYPRSLDELKALPEASLDTAFKSVALAIVSLLNYEQDPQTAIALLEYLNGPDDVSVHTQQFLGDVLDGKFYKVKSFFEGTSPKNDYTPTMPYTIKVSSTPYSFDEENWATLYVHSSGADSPRPIKLRKKPSTGQWFVIDIQCLADIRVPVSSDPWA